MADRSDAELARGWAAGDHSAFSDAYEQYAPSMFGVATGLVRDRSTAADVVHDTFVRAADRISTLRDPERLRPWLFAILRNEAVDALRSSGRERPADVAAMSDQVAAELPEPHTELSRAELADVVWSAADGLQLRDREVLELHLRAGLEATDLADALGVTPGHAAVLLSRMRDRMERAIGALLIARRGRRDCTALDALLAGWDGRFTLDVRSRVTRHVESCPACGRGRLELASYYRLAPALLPVFAIPAELRRRVLSSLQLSSFDTATAAAGSGAPGSGGGAGTWAWREDGFPLPHPGKQEPGLLPDDRQPPDQPPDQPPGHSRTEAETFGPTLLGAALLEGAGAGPPRPAGAVPAELPLPFGPPAPAPRRPGRGRGWLVAAGLVLLLGAGAGVWKALGDTSATTAGPAPVTPTATSTAGTQPTTTGPTSSPPTATASSSTPPPSSPTTLSSPTTPSSAATTATPPAAAHIAAAPLRLAMGSTAGTTTARVTLTNDGGTAAGWTARATGAGLSVSPASGSLAAGAGTRLTVTLNRTGMAEGAAGGQVTVVMPATGQTITLTATGTVEHPPNVTVISRSTATLGAQPSTAACNYPATGTAIAQVSDDGTVTLVTVSWNDGSDHTTRMSLDSPYYYGSFGPFSAVGTTTVTVRATDDRGNVGSASFPVSVRTC